MVYNTPISGQRIRGLSLIEILLGLAIGTICLVALASATTAASRAITTNQRYYQSTQAGRVAMARMAKSIRAAHAVQIGSGSGATAGNWVSGVELFVVDSPTSAAYGYIYDGTNHRLLFDTTPTTTTDTPNISDLVSRMPGNTSTPTVFPLASNVKAVTFRALYGTGGSGVTPVSVNIAMKVGNSSDSITYDLDQSVVPRDTIQPTTAPAP